MFPSALPVFRIRARLSSRSFRSKLAVFPRLTTNPPPHLARITNQVAARLGASVALTDQSKILPTLTRNARSNARDLECRRLPLTSPGCRGAINNRASSQPADAAGHPPKKSVPKNVAKNVPKVASPFPDPDSPATAAVLASAGSSSPAFSGERDGGCDTARGGSSARRPQKGGGGAWGIDAPQGGRWMATELLFSESKEDILRWRGSVGGGAGRGDAISREAEGEHDHGGDADDEGDLFDLVVAADIVYLNDLWNAMAFTMKVHVTNPPKRTRRNSRLRFSPRS